MFIIFLSQHACTILLYMIYYPNYSCVVITFSSRYCQPYVFIILMPYLYCYCIFIFFLLLFFSLLVLFWSGSDGSLFFSVFRSESRYRELIIDHILVQLFCGEFNLFPFLACLIQIWWMILFMF